MLSYWINFRIVSAEQESRSRAYNSIKDTGYPFFDDDPILIKCIRSFSIN